MCTTAVQNKDAPIIGIGLLLRWYWPIVIYTIGKYKFLFLLSTVNKHDVATVSGKSVCVL